MQPHDEQMRLPAIDPVGVIAIEAFLEPGGRVTAVLVTERAPDGTLLRQRSWPFPGIPERAADEAIDEWRGAWMENASPF